MYKAVNIIAVISIALVLIICLTSVACGIDEVSGEIVPLEYYLENEGWSTIHTYHSLTVIEHVYKGGYVEGIVINDQSGITLDYVTAELNIYSKDGYCYHFYDICPDSLLPIETWTFNVDTSAFLYYQTPSEPPQYTHYKLKVKGYGSLFPDIEDIPVEEINR
jgi:hypothetical protein